MFLVQLPMAAVNGFVPKPTSFDDNSGAILLYVLALLVSAVVWWTAVRTFGKAGITRVKDRMWLVFFVLPAGYYNAFLPWVACAMIAHRPTRLWGVLLAAEVVVTTIAAGILVRRIVKKSQPVVAELA